MELADLIYLLFLGIVCWLALFLDDEGGGGGKRARLPGAA
jgi:hypothetical protein